jgi:hypothetical protein
MWDGILERIFELSFIAWSQQYAYEQAVSLWLFRIGEEVR